LETLKQNHDVEIYWRSFELRPAGAPPVPDWYRQKVLAARPHFEESMRQQYGIQINSGPWGINSRPALIGHKIALERGKGEEYHQAIMHAYWAEAQNIEENAVLGDIAQKIGLDREVFLTALKNPAYEQLVSGDILTAKMSGIDAVPALVFQEKYLIKGALPYESLEQVLAKIHESEKAALNSSE